jgi:2-haloacid dehalogenase
MGITAAHENPAFGDLASDSLRRALRSVVDDVDGAADRVLGEFMALPVHGDVVEGIRALDRLGLRLVTLSNGSTSVARGPVRAQRARRAGMAAVWVNRSRGTYPAYFEAPDVVATSLVDLASQLGSKVPGPAV